MILIKTIYCRSCRLLSGNSHLPGVYQQLTSANTFSIPIFDFNLIINRTFANPQQIVANKNGNDDITFIEKTKLTQNAHENSRYQLNLQNREHQSNKIHDKLHRIEEKQQLNSRILSFSSIPNLVKKLVDELEELSHMDEVRKAQERVMIVKDNLKDANERKRDILRRLSSVRDGIKDNHNAMSNVKRGTVHFVDLAKMECDLHTKEKKLEMTFREADDREYNLINELSAAITDSYEKEKIHANSLKLWGFMGSLIASFVTFIASLIGYLYHTSKYGAMTNDFQRSVDKTISKETNLLRKEVHSMKDDLMTMLSSNSKSIFTSGKVPPKESWGSYLNRHTRWTYSWIWPKTK